MFEALRQEDILAIQHVDRWHMIETRRKQHVGEHSYMVALIAAKLASALNLPLTPDERVDMYEGCLLHDVPELKWGDMPTPTKKFLIAQGLAWVLELMEALFWEERGAKRLPLSTATSRVKALVRLADLVEAYTFYQKEGVDMGIKHRLHSDAWDFCNEHFKGENNLMATMAVFMCL